MDTSQIVWIVVAIVVVLIIIGIIARVAGRKKASRNREEAGRIRAEEQESQLQARERENAAQRAQADAGAAELKSKEREIEAQRLQAEAKDAEIAAERKRMDADQQSAAAQEQQRASEERLRHADKLDPDVGKDGARTPVAEATAHRADEAATREPVEDRRSHEGTQRAGTARTPVAGTHDEVHDDRADRTDHADRVGQERAGDPVEPGRRQDAAPVAGEPRAAGHGDVRGDHADHADRVGQERVGEQQVADGPDAYGEASAQRAQRRAEHNDAVDGLDTDGLDASDIDPKGRHGDVPKHRD